MKIHATKFGLAALLVFGYSELQFVAIVWPPCAAGKIADMKKYFLLGLLT